MRRTMCMVVVMVTTLALAAGAALAQATTETIEDTTPLEFTLDQSPCAGELIHVSGQLHTVSHVTHDATGVMHAESHFNHVNVQGTGLVSGGQYRVIATQQATAHGDFEEYPIRYTLQETSNVIGQGQLPDFMLHLTYHVVINEDGTVTMEVINFRAECRNAPASPSASANAQ
jgi:hypothetical protein